MSCILSDSISHKTAPNGGQTVAKRRHMYFLSFPVSYYNITMVISCFRREIGIAISIYIEDLIFNGVHYAFRVRSKVVLSGTHHHLGGYVSPTLMCI